MRYPTEQGFYRLDEAGFWLPTDRVALQHIAGAKAAIQLETIVYVAKDGTVSLAPVEQHTDGGTKPEITWGWLGHPFDDYLLSYVTHDGDYEMIGKLWQQGWICRAEAEEMRKESDRRFRESQFWIKRHLLGKTKSRFERLTLRAKYAAVRLAGGRLMRHNVRRGKHETDG